MTNGELRFFVVFFVFFFRFFSAELCCFRVSNFSKKKINFFNIVRGHENNIAVA